MALWCFDVFAVTIVASGNRHGQSHAALGETKKQVLRNLGETPVDVI
jgi:hypothetical protein